MEKMWSPWRSVYIDSFSSRDENTGCVLCDAGSGDAEDLNNLVIDKGEYTYTVLNLFPYNNGHLMVVPNRHTSELDSFSDEEMLEIMKKLKIAKKALMEVSHPEGFNIGANLGKVAGAGIDEHIHFHIVPRWNGDTNFMPVLGEVKIISQDLLSTKKKLLKAYKKLNSEK
jgi:ATP adenylyltransferase